MTNVCAFQRGHITYLDEQVIPTTSDTDKRSALFSCLFGWWGYL